MTIAPQPPFVPEAAGRPRHPCCAAPAGVGSAAAATTGPGEPSLVPSKAAARRDDATAQ
jgi:hypothetical protein